MKEELQLRSTPCKTCPFGPQPIALEPERLAQIHQYLLEGNNHLCHSDLTNRTVCRGGRNWQIEMLSRLGTIAAPNHDALAAAMRTDGIEPNEHVLQGCNQSKE